MASASFAFRFQGAHLVGQLLCLRQDRRPLLGRGLSDRSRDFLLGRACVLKKGGQGGARWASSAARSTSTVDSSLPRRRCDSRTASGFSRTKRISIMGQGYWAIVAKREREGNFGCFYVVWSLLWLLWLAVRLTIAADGDGAAPAALVSYRRGNGSLDSPPIRGVLYALPV